VLRRPPELAALIGHVNLAVIIDRFVQKKLTEAG
jgi:hypothetical protein